MNNAIKRILSRTPQSLQQSMKRIYFKHQLKHNKFISDEPEFHLLDSWVGKGDWVLDIGANIGHYTCRLSEITGDTGRVISIEPVIDSFELLANNIYSLPSRNVTLLNICASEKNEITGMEIPKFDTGLDNFYRAHATYDTSNNLKVLNLTIDSLNLPHPLKLAKIDVEGNELSVLKGMISILERDKPVLIVEDNSREVGKFLEEFGYTSRIIDGSPNIIFEIHY